jgi:uncharacterized membrane protein
MIRMSRFGRGALPLGCFLLLGSLAGCNSPYHADRGALAGGLGGAGVGALIGHATGHTGAGAAIGAGVGALTGAAVGGTMDDMEARNRAMIEQQMGRNVAPGAVTVVDVITMTEAGVAEELIVNHIRSHGMAAPLSSQDVIALQNSGVPTRAISAMQTTPPPQAVQQVAAPPVVVQEHYYADPYYYRPYHGYHYRHHYHHGLHPGTRVGWGVSVNSHH